MNANNVQASNPIHEIPIPGLPTEIGLNILRYLPCTIVNKCLTLDKQTWASRFQVQWILFLQKEALTSSELKQYQRLFSLQANPNQIIVKSWEEVAKDQLFHNVKSLSFDVAVSAEDMVSIIMRCPNLTSIDLGACSAEVSNAALIALTAHCPKLNSITLNDSGLSNDALIQFGQNSHQLTSVNLNNCRSITNEVVIAFATSGYNLKSLNLTECRNISDTALFRLAADCPNLVSINLSKCPLITDNGVIELARYCPFLNSIDLSSSPYADDAQIAHIGDASLRSLAINCPALTSVNLRGRKMISDDALILLAKENPNLTSLDLFDLNISDKSIVELARRSPKLTSINLSKCANISDTSIIALMLHCPKHELSIGDTPKVTTLAYYNQYRIDAEAKVLDRNQFSGPIEEMSHAETLSGEKLVGYQRLFSGPDSIKSWAWLAKSYKLSLTNLKELNLNDKDSKTLSEEDLITILKMCPNLTTIHLNIAGQEINTALVALASYCPKMVSIQVKPDYCNLEVTSDTIEALAMNCPDLTSIDLSNCKKITDDALKALGKYCNKLTAISLKGCHNYNLRGITDTGLIALVDGCPLLTSIDLGGCSDLTDGSIIHLAKQLPNLEFIDFSQAYSIGNNALIALGVNCLKLKSVLSSGSAVSFECQKWFTQYQAARNDVSTAEQFKKEIAEFALLETADARTLAKYRHLFSSSPQESETSWARLVKNNQLSLPNLKKLDLGEIKYSLWRDSAEYFSEEDIVAMIKLCPNLTEIDLSDCSDAVINSALVALATYCPKLSSIRLFGEGYHNHDLSSDAMEAFAMHCPNVTAIDLSQWKTITGDAVRTMSQYWPNLTALNLSECTLSDDAISAIAAFKNLKSLSLKEASIPSEEGFAQFAAQCPSTITSIDLSGLRFNEIVGTLIKRLPNVTSINFNSSAITDSNLKELIEHCPLLTSINLGKCYGITDEGLEKLAKAFPKLTSIQLCGRKISDAAVNALIENCPDLTSISLDSCNITDAAVKAIATKYPNLTKITLDGCKISDVAILALAEGCKKLTSIGLCYCKIKPATRLRLVKACPDLSYMDLRQCGNVYTKDIEEMRSLRAIEILS